VISSVVFPYQWKSVVNLLQGKTLAWDIQMNRYPVTTLLLPILFFVLLAGCAASKITASWVDPTFNRAQLHSILVLGVSQQDLFRRTFEDEMVSQLKRYGLNAVPSYRSISGEDLPEKQEMEQWVGSQKVDGVLVSRLVGTHQETVVSPGYTTSFGSPPPGPYWGGRHYPGGYPYGGWYDYYAGSYDIIHHPPQVTHYQIHTIETTLYLVASDQPVWSARSEISQQDDMNRVMEEFVAQLVKNMADKGVL
jgi:hypothetical protein